MRALPYVAFFCSGASSLIFQALWTRMLHHTFGATSVAMSSVLTAFMGGLGLGAHLFGKRVRHMARPLRVYAACELLVAAWALLIPWLVRSEGPFSALNAWLRASFGESSFSFMVARFVCVLPVLLVPTTLMGGTLPLLAAHFVPERDGSKDASAKVGGLYAVNTFGAVAGSLLGSFVLMPSIGVHRTNLAAVGINACLGVVIWLWAGRRSETVSAPAPQGSSAARTRAPWPNRIAAIAFGCSGACAMAYEVVWSRALSMAIGSSLQAFALILVTFLVGIASGSALLSALTAPGRSDGRALWLHAGSAVLLCLLALTPAWVLSSAALTLSVWLLLTGALLGAALLASRGAERARLFDHELAKTAVDLERVGRRLLVVPVVVALFESARFALHRGPTPSVSVHGYLPFITCSVVLCLAAFSWLISSLRAAPWHLAAAVQLFVAGATLVSCAFQDEIPYTFARLVSSVRDLPNQVGTVRFFMFFAASLCTLPATLGMGAMFPITLRLWSLRGAQASTYVGEDVGTVYAANTLGSILGAWLPGFVLLPLLGMQRTLDLGITLNLLVALAMLVSARAAGERRPAARWGIAGVAGALAVLLLQMLTAAEPALRWNLSHMTLGAFRVSLAKDVLDVRSWGKSDLVYYRDGVSTTVSVERWGRHLSLKNNGKVDASNGDDMPTQIMVAAYPLLLHPRGARDLDVAIVGFGSGVTVGAALQFPVRHIDAMELERAVVEAGADFFADVSHLPRQLDAFPYVRAPRLSLHNDDGRNYLAASRKRYDVIVSEPSNPWITGVSDLFTSEHFRISKQRLKPDGVYCQWVQLYEMSPENIKTIYRTFASHFRYVLAFAAEELSSDTILVGSDQPLPMSLSHVAQALTDPRVASELERAYVHSPYDVWSRILFASKAEIMAFTQREQRLEGGVWRDQMRATGSAPCPAASCRRSPAPLNTDDNMLIELGAPADLIGFARYEGYLGLFYGPDWPYGMLSGRLAGLQSREARVEMALALLAHGRKQHARALLFSTSAEDSQEVRAGERVARLLLGELPEPQPTLEPPAPGPLLAPGMQRAFTLAMERVQQHTAKGEHAAALRIMQALPETLRRLSGPSFRFLYGLLLLRAAEGERQRLKKAAAELEDLIRKDELYTALHPELYYFLARAQDAAASFDKAVRNMRAYVALTALR